jgi:hypothetical protein
MGNRVSGGTRTVLKEPRASSGRETRAERPTSSLPTVLSQQKAAPSSESLTLGPWDLGSPTTEERPTSVGLMQTTGRPQNSLSALVQNTLPSAPDREVRPAARFPWVVGMAKGRLRAMRTLRPQGCRARRQPSCPLPFRPSF